MLGDFDSWSIPDLVRELNHVESRLQYVYCVGGDLEPTLSESDQLEVKRLVDRRLDLISATVKKMSDKIN